VRSLNVEGPTTIFEIQKGGTLTYKQLTLSGPVNLYGTMIMDQGAVLKGKTLNIGSSSSELDGTLKFPANSDGVLSVEVINCKGKGIVQWYLDPDNVKNGGLPTIFAQVITLECFAWVILPGTQPPPPPNLNSFDATSLLLLFNHQIAGYIEANIPDRDYILATSANLGS
jgi:hypothetical protein